MPALFAGAAIVGPATDNGAFGRIEDEPVYIRLRSALPNTGGDSDGTAVAEPEIALTVMPFNTWQVVKRRIKERWPVLKAVPDIHIRLLYKSVELRAGMLVDQYVMDGGFKEEAPIELQYLIIDQGHAREHNSARNVGLVVDSQVPCTPRLKACVTDCRLALLRGIQPRLTDEGTGATYMLRDPANTCNLAVFKPKDEEAFAPQNPRGYVGEENSTGLRQGILSTQQAAREVAAYLLDHDKFAGVPETTLVHAKHPKFVKVRTKKKEAIVWKIGAFQAFVEAKDTAGNFAPQVFEVSDIHRIGILDIRVVNLDRNDGNLLARHRRRENSSGVWELVPIDHGLSLPDRLEVYTDDIGWMSWPQARKPFGDHEREYVRRLDGSRDAKLLAKYLGIRRECLRLMEVTTKLLQIGVEYGLTLYHIGTLLYRVDRGSDMPVQRSSLEKIIEVCLDIALATAGGTMCCTDSETLKSLDLRTSRPVGGQGAFVRQASPAQDNKSPPASAGLTPQIGPSSPLSSPLSTSPLGEVPPPYLLPEALSESDTPAGAQPESSAAARGAALPGSAAQTFAGALAEKKALSQRFLDLGEDLGGRSLRQSYKAGTSGRARAVISSSRLTHCREGEGGDAQGSIFWRQNFEESDWTPELETVFIRKIDEKIREHVKKTFPLDALPEESSVGGMEDSSSVHQLPPAPELSPGHPPVQQSPVAAAFPPEHRPGAEDAPTALVVAEPKVEPRQEEAPPPKPKWVPSWQRRAAAAAAAAGEPAAPVATGGQEGGSASSSVPPGAPPGASGSNGDSANALPTDASGGAGRSGWCVNQGPRANMEDAIDVISQLDMSEQTEFYAVYDGHGGTEAVTFVKRQLPRAICRSRGILGDAEQIEAALREAFAGTDEECLQHLSSPSRQPSRISDSSKDQADTYTLTSGCVCCVVLLRGSKVYVANLGDCRAVICNDGEMVCLTVDHRPEVNEGERERLKELGVEVSSDGYLHGRIGVSRAFGDWAWERGEKCHGISCCPEVSMAEVTPDTEFLLLACDGVFEKMTTREAGQIVRRRLRATGGDAKASCEALVKHALARSGSDNLSAVVVVFRAPTAAADSGRTAPRLFGRAAAASATVSAPVGQASFSASVS